MPSRAPTVEELAKALDYIEHEYKLPSNASGCHVIDGEMWADGLAWYRNEAFNFDKSMHAYYMTAAREAKNQLTDRQWEMLTARADYLRATETPTWQAPRYKR